MEKDFAGVRVIPSSVCFNDTELNTLYSINVTVKNISKSSKSIRYYAPQTKQFALKVKNPGIPVAPGLEVSAVVEYSTTEAAERKDRIVVTVDDEVVEIPVLAHAIRPKLSLEGPVDFGNVVANSKVISRELILYNHGSAPGEYAFKYSGSKPIQIVPHSGSVPPNTAQTIMVEYVTKNPGHFNETAQVMLQGRELDTIQITGTVVQGLLQLLDCESGRGVSCVQFGSTYYGTDKTEPAILYNNSPSPVSYVSVLDEEAVGQELGLNDSTSGGEMNKLTSLVTAIPNQGTLGPYEKIHIFFRFSPRWNMAEKGFRCTQEQPPEKKFALMMQLKTLGARNSGTSESGSILQVPLTGTALPVLLSLSPQSKYDFNQCVVGERIEALGILHNDSTCMPITYQFRRIAQYSVKPPNGKIKPGNKQEIVIAFSPNQVGTFNSTLSVDVIGQVNDKFNPFLTHLQVISTMDIKLAGSSDPITIKKKAVFNPGITPKITNEVGLYVDTKVAKAEKTPRNAMHNAQGTILHRTKEMKEISNHRALVAFPNDRAASIRPSDRREDYKTIFTRRARHTFVDPDYAYSKDETDIVKAHKQHYIDYVKSQRENRINTRMNKEYMENNNETDIAIKPAAGLKPRKFNNAEIGTTLRVPTPPNAAFQLMSNKELEAIERKSSKRLRDGLNAVPNTPQEKIDCQRLLSPQELHQVIIGPATVDFGQVCLRSQSQKELSIVNNLNRFIHVEVNVTSKELCHTSPLSQVVPPCSKAILPLIFESNSRGRFQRSVDYTINKCYSSHVTVFAEVVSVALELSTSQLELKPNSVVMPVEHGMRGTVTILNKLNYQAEFTWTPIMGDRGTAFSIRPATGVIDAYSDLDCEVVFHTSYVAPDEGLFALHTHGGNTLELRCNAVFGNTNVQFIDRRIMLGQVPLHLTTTRAALIRNNDSTHAFFEVMDPNPFPGLSVSPIHGVIPVGGNGELQVTLTPNAVLKFDTRVQVAIRGSKPLELRLGGAVEPPCVDIDVGTFNLGGVYCGSSDTIKFQAINKANTKVKLEFDLTRFKDFSLDFPSKASAEEHSYRMLNPGMFTVTLDALETVDGKLRFKPTEVASYDFIIPVTVNQTNAPSPMATPAPPTPAPSNKNSLPHIVVPRPIVVTIATPRKKVLATALRQPLQISHQELEFLLSPGEHEMATASGIGQSKGTMFVNNSDRKLKWTVDLNQGNQVLEEGVFKFLHSSGMPFLSHGGGGVEGELEPGQTYSLGVLFCPVQPGHYEVTVPVILDDDYKRPYQYIHLVGYLKAPVIWFDPLAIVLTPVPLDTEVSTEFTLLAANYTKSSAVSVEIPNVECEDGSKVSPLNVTFLQYQEIKPCCGAEGDEEPYELSCCVTFKSRRPISFTTNITFSDDDNRQFTLPVTAAADNSLLTNYSFLAQHRGDHHIVCEMGTSLKGRKPASRESATVGEAVLLPCVSPPHASSRPSTTATSSNFDYSSSSFEDSVTDSTFPSTPRDGALNKFNNDSEPMSRGRTDLASRSLGSALFPEEDSEEGIFYTEVLLAVQRWFSAQGWPGGPHPIIVPDSLRSIPDVVLSDTKRTISRYASQNMTSGLSKKPLEEKPRNAKGGTWEANNLKKEFKTVYDMISYLCGKQVPGIPINNPLPEDAIERAKQVYWQHSTLLTFLRTQGACISSVKPEYLMCPQDYKNWVILQRQLQATSHESGHWYMPVKTLEEEDLEDQLFEAVSKRAWIDVLLQLLKTLVLAKVTPRQFKNIRIPERTAGISTVDPDPLCSNVYSISERIVLLWINHLYEQHRERIWQSSQKGGVPPSRWVVNFDFDLLDGVVIAALLGAHAPYLVKSHLIDMYTKPSTAEQCLHNALRVVGAMECIGIEYDIQATDITDPNPISLLLLCLHLYQQLPQYIPKNSVHFMGGLHTTVFRQVSLSNPSGKQLIYTAMIVGQDKDSFNLPKGSTVTLGPRTTLNMVVEFTSRYLRPAEAVLVLVGRRHGAQMGSTLVFNLKTQIDDITTKFTVKCESPCYEFAKIELDVKNPFPQGGKFKILLAETTEDLPQSLGFTTKSLSKSLTKKKSAPKKVTARTDHGQKRSEIEDDEKTYEGRDAALNAALSKCSMTDKSDPDTAAMSSFNIRQTEITIEADGSGFVEVGFLPFNLGQHQCTVIFVNETIGEFLYAVHATATLPLAAHVPYTPGGARISNSAAAGGGRSVFGGGGSSVVYWKCKVGQTITECLKVPVENLAQEKALGIAAQLHMSDEELERRRVTGQLHTSAVREKTIRLLSTNYDKTVKMMECKEKTFKIEVDSENFTAPATYEIKESDVKRIQSAPTKSGSPRHDKNAIVSTISVPITFTCKDPGHYPCRVTLRSTNDVRVYHIECIATPEGNEARLQYTSPVHQPITQDIPIKNTTDDDWHLQVDLDGVGFIGPQTLYVRGGGIASYPLLFRPQYEGTVIGKLMLVNAADGVEHVFHLEGTGEKPLPLENIVFNTQVKQRVTQLIKVPNVTKRKLHFKAESDLSFVTGKDSGITVLPGQTADYQITVNPVKRGTFKGVLSFVATSNPNKEVDSDGDEVSDDESMTDRHGYRVWYSVEVNVTPLPQQSLLQLTCACQKKAVVEIGLNNPTNEEMILDVEIQNDLPGLSGPPTITLQPNARGVYLLVYAPAIIGTNRASITFFNPIVGEFWYGLELTALPPRPTDLPNMTCELGRWVRQNITLQNPTDETLKLISTISNSNNFVLERDDDLEIEMGPQSSLTLPLMFMPSDLGEADHQAKVSFLCEQLGEWVFNVKGEGYLPQPQDTVSITSLAGSSSTLIIPFRNPLDFTVVVEVILTDEAQLTSQVLDIPLKSGSPFSLLLKHTKRLRLGPKQSLDVPISFAPSEMSVYKALLAVIIQKEDGSTWPYDLSKETKVFVPRSDTGGLHEIRWLYPIQGYPELSAPADDPPAILRCQARTRVEERLEVTLAGVAPSAAGAKRGITARAATPAGTAPKLPDGVVLGETMAMAEEFSFELLYADSDAHSNIEPAVALSLVRHQRDISSGLVTLLFNAIFAPYKSMNYEVMLQVKGATGGLWKFPLHFIATEPDADDVITIEAAGLSKESSVGFRLHSQTRHPVPFNAYFLADSDPDFRITPQSGELLPPDANGTLLKVLFTPHKYGKIYQGKLVIQSPDMQWMYSVRGTLPEYNPPRGQSVQPMAGPHPDPRQRKTTRANFVRDNLKLTTTAVSSPIKGAKIINITKQF